MKKLAIIYFSGTGNTKYIAEKMKEAAVKTNTQVDLINIEKDKINTHKYDNIVIGGPVYVERYPEILLKYIENNLSNYNGNCMMYSTQAFNGPTPVFAHAVKRLKNLKFVYYNYVPMPNNFYTFMFKKYNADKKADLVMSSSIQAQIMVLEFLEGKTKSYKTSRSRIFLAEKAYKMTFPLLRKFLMKSLKIDKDKCS
ncbi:MAG: EFR1 family ferrodoxin, partial [Bacillota bacterium]|nr:EFR1 family ferrodoxin [Bacillota bacterium]